MQGEGSEEWRSMFSSPWTHILAPMPEVILVVGKLPWVPCRQLGARTSWAFLSDAGGGRGVKSF